MLFRTRRIMNSTRRRTVAKTIRARNRLNAITIKMISINEIHRVVRLLYAIVESIYSHLQVILVKNLHNYNVDIPV